MKPIKLIFIIVAILLTSVVVSCGGSSEKSEPSKEMSKEYSSAYLCPMHCEGSGSENEGTCPVCGMDYEKNDDHNSNNHSH